nr:alpha/beta hydrolase [Desulfobacterales bacterium]
MKNIEEIKKVNFPVLIIHGDADTIVPYDLGRRLFDAANLPKRFYTVKRAGHNNTYELGGKAYLEIVESFIQEALMLDEISH